VVGKDCNGCRAVAPEIMALVGAAREHGVPVFWIKANYDPDRLPEGMLASRERRVRYLLRTGSWGIDFYGVAPVPLKRDRKTFLQCLRRHRCGSSSSERGM